MSNDVTVGTMIGSYQIERELGRGGFGVVYVAVDTRLGRRAAIKQLLPELSSHREIVERFFNEAKAAANINHAGIIEIYDVGWHTDGSAYFAMKLLDGESLARRLRSTGPMPIALAATIARQVSSALVAAHTRGIVHRDLKPDNVMLIEDDEIAIGERAVVLDFGIAKLSGGQGASHTRSGMMMGTPGYMSPEQCRGAGEVDHRTDLYAMGCILFEMLTGRAPFVAVGPGEVMGMHQFVEPPSVRSLRQDVPTELEAVVMRLLAKQVDNRMQLMTELVTALQPFASGGRSARHPAQPSTPLPQASPVAETVKSANDLVKVAPALTPSTPATVTPPPVIPSVPAPQTTLGSAPGEIVTQPTPGSRRGLMIGIGAAAVAAIGITIAVARGGGGSESAKTVTAAPPTADATIAPEPTPPLATPDAPPLIDSSSTAASPADELRTTCLHHKTNKKWKELAECAGKLGQLDPVGAKPLSELARKETKHEGAFRALTVAIREKDLAKAKLKLGEIAPDSVYRPQAQLRFSQAEKEENVTAVAPPSGPSGYACPPGTPNKGIGCTCPTGYASKLDGKNIATCEKAASAVYVNVGAMISKAGAGADTTYVAKMVATTKLTLAKLAPTFQQTWPGGTLPTKQQLEDKKAKGFHVDATLNSVTTTRSGSNAVVECKISMLVASFPGKDIFGFLNGGAKVQGDDTPEGLQAATLDCVEAVVEDLVGKKVIPSIKSKL